MVENSLSKSKTKVVSLLSERQLEVLQVLYKFRFATAQLIGVYQSETAWACNARLQSLVNQEYIGCHFDANSHSNHLAATYFLLPKGIRYLRKHTETDAAGLKLCYNNRKAKADFIEHALRVFRIYLQLDDLILDDLEFYSSSELLGQATFPTIRPDAYIRFTGTRAGLPHCMLDVIERSSSLPRIKRHVLRYLEHYAGEHDWGEAYPHVLLVCDDPELEVKIGQYIAAELTKRGLPKPRYYTTTFKTLGSLTHEANAIWSDVRDPEVPRIPFRGMSAR